jgi:glycosyltransferase involved in cell wall biosynthesis
VRNAFGVRAVRMGPAHGDYAPWNTLQMPDGVLYVFDWEHASTEAPLLTDLFHRVVMPARLVLRHTPRKVIERLSSLADDPLLGDVIAAAGVHRNDVPAYALLYLLGLAMRDEAEYGRVSDFVAEALELARQSLDHGRRRKVLVAAYACEPGAGSEPGVGWNVCQAISREHEAWVITRRNNRDAIEAALVRAPNPNLHFHYADLPRWARFWKRGGRGIRTYYYLWQFAAALEAWRLTRRVRFDVAHHVTFVNSYVFSFLALLPLPFVWGPLGSNPLLPASLAATKRALLRDRLRYAWQRLLRVVDPLFWLCAYRARVILGINESIGRHLPFAVFAPSKFGVHPAIGVEGHVPGKAVPRTATDAIRILSMGQMIPIKGFHLALRAFAELLRTRPAATLDIVGDGPEKPALQRLAAMLGITDNVHFTGWLPRHEAVARFTSADIFLFASCEGGGMVVLEAMANGVPAVCLDYGGPGEMVSSDCGIVVSVADLDSTVSGLARALGTLAGDPSLRQRMAQAARTRIAERYSWELRHEFIGRWYEAALSESARAREARAT